MPTPLINGINYSWANVSLVLFGVPVVGITKISYNQKQKKENNYGAGYYAVSRGHGNVEAEASIELYTDEWRRIIASSPNRNPLAIPPFDIQVVFESENGVETDILRSVEFMDDPLAANQGDTKLMVNIPLIVALVEHL